MPRTPHANPERPANRPAKRPAKHRLSLALALAGLIGSAAQAAPSCYPNYGAIEAKKPNKLFLYFPTSDDPTFPNYDPVYNPGPAKTFDVSLIPNGPATTTAALRNRIYDVVATDYCEFNVHVQFPTTTNPDALVSPPARRNMVAIGADTNASLYGLAQAVDIGDAHGVDHARVWAGTYAASCGGPGGQLDGVNNTLDRWALGIGGTAAHEAGHNYGLAHSTALHTGEDPITNHIMPAGGNIPCVDRVSHLRHFSDQDYGILANNVGLTVQTLANWDFVNPNAFTADSLRMEVLSLSASLTPTWVYRTSPTYLSRSPWDTPTISGPVGTKVYKGVVYNRFLVTWSTPETWTGALPGGVQGGETFHLGASFSEEDILNTSTEVVISDVTLLRGGNPLPLHPRAPSYNSGTLGPAGGYTINLANLANVALLLRNVQAWVLPRPLDIRSMIRTPAGGIDFFDVQGQPVTPWRQVQLPTTVELPAGSPDKPAETALSVGNLLRDGHNIRVKTNLESRDAIPGATEANKVQPGALLTDPFPGAAVFVTADLVEPGATQWDPAQQKYVSKDLVTSVFLQVAGKRVKPVDGALSGLLRGKVVCSNLNTRASVTLTPDANGGFDCEKSGLVSQHGDRVQVTQLGIVAAGALPAVQLGGLDIGKVTCTNLNTRRTLSFVPALSTAPLDCAKAGLGIEANNTLELIQVGTVR